MSRIVYVDGVFCLAEEAKVSIFNRGFMFADGVYEVTAVIDGKLIDYPHHMSRLRESLWKLSIPCSMSDHDFLELHKELVRRNKINEGSVYLQVTRGVADRDFFYEPDMQPTIVLFTQEKEITVSRKAETGMTVNSVPDLRWRWRDIKSISLLAQVMAKQAAVCAGCDEAWMIDEDGTITEGASSSVFIIDARGYLIIRPLNHDILPGVTRTVMLELAEELQIKIEERTFTLQDAYEAKEAFNTSACGLIMPVVKIDDHVIMNGRPGPIVTRLRELYINRARQSGIPV